MNDKREARSKIANALTVDVEDYFHVTALADSIDRDSWQSLESRVQNNTERLLQLFDDNSVSATFFVLGCVAEEYPQLVRRIVENGHELGCHGLTHQLIYKQDKKDFREETVRAKMLLEDISGTQVAGYRAASYSITTKSIWAVEILIDAGFEYDSSIVPVKHDIYGIEGAKVFPYRIRLQHGKSLVEFPPSTISILRQRFPVGGGGYFRFFPYWFTRWALNQVNMKSEMPFSFYLHPWEIDPDQPRISSNWKSTFRHYNNLDKCEARLRTLLTDFEFGTMRSCLGRLVLEDFELSIQDDVDEKVAR